MVLSKEGLGFGICRDDNGTMVVLMANYVGLF